MSVRVVGVIGAGQMGQGIAQVSLTEAKCEVVLLDANAAIAEKAAAEIGKRLNRLVEKAQMPGPARDEAMKRLRPASDYAALAACDIIIEAAPEREELKLGIFRKLNEVAKPEAILASNTSSISITKLGATTTRPERVVGMHFMNPVPLMKLVEVVRGLPTSDATFAATVEFAKALNKVTIASRDIPGFIVNRVLIPLLNEACYALYEGLGNVRDIDTGVKLGLNHPMGPLELADLIGLDTCLAIAEVLHHELGDDKYRPCPLLRQHVAAGWLGRKSKRGFYQYDESGKKIEVNA